MGKATEFIEKSVYIDEEGIDTLTVTEAHFALKLKELETLEPILKQAIELNNNETSTCYFNTKEIELRVAQLKKETKSK